MIFPWCGEKLFLFSITLLYLSLPFQSFAQHFQSINASNPVSNKHFTCAARDILICYEAGSGKKVWQNKDINDARGLILFNDQLYLTQHKSINIYRIKDGELVNSIATDSILFDPVITSSHIILSSHTGELSVINRPQGTVLWQRKLDTGWLYPPAIYENSIITGGQSGFIWAASLDNGQPLWHKNLNQELVYRLQMSNDDLIISTFDGKIRSMNPINGNIIWEQTLDSPLIDIQINTPGRIIASGFDGKIHSFNSSGQLIWQTQAHSTARFNYSSNLKYIASIDHWGHLKIHDNQTGKLIKESKIEGNHQVSPLLMHSSIWLFPDNKPAITLKLSSIQ